jgi:peptide/nickel transport system permease protein
VSTPAVAQPTAQLRRRPSARALGSPALRLIGKRLATAIPVLWGVTFLTFLVVNRLPGNAAQQLLGINATQQQINELKAKLNLDEPFFTRYWHWLSHAVTGDLGSSFASDQSVTSILNERLPVTFELLAYALIVSLAFTVPVALLAARRPNGIVDRITMAISMVGLSVANYVLALILVYVFAVKLDVLPAIGYTNPSDGLWPFIKSLTLPAISIGFPLFCFYTRLLRADILEQMQGEDYVVTAAAKGVGPWRVLVRHALPNSLFGLLTVVGLNIGTLIGVTVIIESIFGLPGIGQALLQAINNRDVLVVQGIVLVLAVVVVLANLVTDLLYAVLDPRIRYGRTAA